MASQLEAIAGPPLVVEDVCVAVARRNGAQRTASAGGDGVPLGAVRALAEVTDQLVGDIAWRWAPGTRMEGQLRQWRSIGGGVGHAEVVREKRHRGGQERLEDRHTTAYAIRRGAALG